jgi:hypothetical protein
MDTYLSNNVALLNLQILQAHLCLDIDRVFGGTGEPYIFLDRDAWDRGLVVPAYSLYIFKNFLPSFFHFRNSSCFFRFEFYQIFTDEVLGLSFECEQKFWEISYRKCC